MIVFLHIFMLYNVNNLCVKEWDLNKLLAIYLSLQISIFSCHLGLDLVTYVYLPFLTLKVLVMTIDVLRSFKQNNYSTVGGDGGCRVGKVRSGTTSPMPDHKGLSYSNCQRATHAISKWIFRKLALYLRVNYPLNALHRNVAVLSCFLTLIYF